MSTDGRSPAWWEGYCESMVEAAVKAERERCAKVATDEAFIEDVRSLAASVLSQSDGEHE